MWYPSVAWRVSVAGQRAPLLQSPGAAKSKVKCEPDVREPTGFCGGAALALATTGTVDAMALAEGGGIALAIAEGSVGFGLFGTAALEVGDAVEASLVAAKDVAVGAAPGSAGLVAVVVEDWGAELGAVGASVDLLHPLQPRRSSAIVESNLMPP